MSFFSSFPRININNKYATNLMASIRFKELTTQNKFSFYPYTVKEGDRIDTIAYHYYKDDSYAWLVMLSNNIVDPMFDWPLNHEDFIKFLENKYDSLIWTHTNIKEYRVKQNQDTLTIAQYNSLDDSLKKYWSPTVSYKGDIIEYNRKILDLSLTPDSYDELSANEKAYWSSISYYDYEHEVNENKRFIRLLDSRNAKQVETEMRKLFT